MNNSNIIISIIIVLAIAAGVTAYGALPQEVLEQAPEQVLEVAQAAEQEAVQVADPAQVVAAADLTYHQARQNQLQLAR